MRDKCQDNNTTHHCRDKGKHGIAQFFDTNSTYSATNKKVHSYRWGKKAHGDSGDHNYAEMRHVDTGLNHQRLKQGVRMRMLARASIKVPRTSSIRIITRKKIILFSVRPESRPTMALGTL